MQLSGHTEEGFALNWHPVQGEWLLSGGYDGKILQHEAEKGGEAMRAWDVGEGVEDVKWSHMNPEIFASAQQNQHVSLYIFSEIVGT